MIAACLKTEPHDALLEIPDPDCFLGARGITVNAVVFYLKTHLVEKVRGNPNFLRERLLKTYPQIGKTLVDHCELRSDPAIRALANLGVASEEELAQLITVARMGTRDGKGKALAAENPLRWAGSERHFDPLAKDKSSKRDRGNTMVFPHFSAFQWLEEYTKGEIKVDMITHALNMAFVLGTAMVRELGCTALRPPPVLNSDASATAQPDPLPNGTSSAVKFVRNGLTGHVKQNTAGRALSQIQAQSGGKKRKLVGGTKETAVVLDDSDSGDDVPLSERGAKKVRREEKEASGEASGTHEFPGSAFDPDAF